MRGLGISTYQHINHAGGLQPYYSSLVGTYWYLDLYLLEDLQTNRPYCSQTDFFGKMYGTYLDGGFQVKPTNSTLTFVLRGCSVRNGRSSTSGDYNN